MEVQTSSVKNWLRSCCLFVSWKFRVQCLLRYSVDDWSGFNCSLTRAVDGRIVRCGIVSSCRSADFKTLLFTNLSCAIYQLTWCTRFF